METRLAEIFSQENKGIKIGVIPGHLPQTTHMSTTMWI